MLIRSLGRAGKVWGEGAIKVQVGSGALAISKRTVSLFVLAHIFFLIIKLIVSMLIVRRGNQFKKQ